MLYDIQNDDKRRERITHFARDPKKEIWSNHINQNRNAVLWFFYSQTLKSKLYVFAYKKTKHFRAWFTFAERKGFEPSIRFRIHTFQACAFDHSATSLFIFKTNFRLSLRLRLEGTNLSNLPEFQRSTFLIKSSIIGINISTPLESTTKSGCAVLSFTPIISPKCPLSLSSMENPIISWK